MIRNAYAVRIKIEMWVVLFVLFVFGVCGFVPQKSLPVYLHTDGGGASVLVAVIGVGARPVQKLFALQATGASDVVLFDGSTGPVVLWIAGEPRQFPAVAGAGPDASLGCSTCRGILPIGRGSPLWNPFRNVTFTGDALLFDERVFRPREQHVPCQPLSAGICDLPAKFNGSPVLFSLDLSDRFTYVPSALFYEFLGDKHPEATPARKWDGIDIEIDGGPTIHLPGREIVSEHTGFTPQLFILPYDGSSIRAGADILRFASFRWDVAEATMQIEPRVARRGYSGLTVVLIVIATTAWFYLRNLRAPGAVAIGIDAASFALLVLAALLRGRILLDDITLLVLTCVAFAVFALVYIAVFFVQTRTRDVRWLWRDQMLNGISQTMLLYAMFLLALEPRIYYYTPIPALFVGAMWVYTTFEEALVLYRDTRGYSVPVFRLSWAGALVWALLLTTWMHSQVFLPYMQAVSPGGGAGVVMLLGCLYALGVLFAVIVTKKKHRRSKALL